MSLGNKSYISKFYMFCNSLVVGGNQNSEQNLNSTFYRDGTKLILVWHNGKMIVDVFFKRASSMVMAILGLF